MKIEEFALERIQSLHENEVELNLSDSGVHPYDLRTLLTMEERESLLDIELGYGHTHGSPLLREAIAGLYAHRSADEIMVTTGGIEANFLLVMTLVAPGDRVVVLTPNYLQIAGWARAAGGDVREVPLDGSADWSLDRQRLEDEIVSGTRLVTLCVPNNPTGTVLGKLIVRGLWIAARRRVPGCTSMRFTRARRWMVTSRPVGPMPARTCSCPTAHPRRLRYRDCASAGWSDQRHRSTLPGSARITRRSLLQRSRKRLRSWCSNPIGGRRFSSVPGPGCAAIAICLAIGSLATTRSTGCVLLAGGMGFVSYDLPIGSDALSQRMRTEESTPIVPGTCYGLDGHFRVGIGAPPAVLEQGLARLASLAGRIRAAA